ncbi:MAG TPA: sigma-70 family RNA polymerase sigma factor [Vicinamibacterales bacterium]|nr:sigma-70 family RNA polymerase sigma factor [Vicinamibacterales bacterium]
MPDSQAGEVTRLLKAWHGGDEEAYRQLSAMLYDELKRQAAGCMRGERPGITLQATALVHEAFVRLAGAGEVGWQDRKHFLAVAARTMRRVLVDVARANATGKRGAGAEPALLDSNIVAPGASVVDLIALDEALEKLATFDARKVRVIELRYFAGLTVEETAEVLEVAPDTVARDWRLARSWLLQELDPQSEP